MNSMKTIPELLLAWWDGEYALGWRGWLAMKLLRPVLNEEIVKILDL